jgi:adenosine deaminase
MTAAAPDRRLAELIRRMPKAELHVHVEGSIEPATLLQLAARRGEKLPADDEAGVREWFRFRDFAHFVEVYLACSRCLREPEDFQLVVADFMAGQARQNILYTEAHFTISTHVGNGADPDELAQALRQTIDEGRRRWGIELRLIPDIVRNVGPEAADLTLEWALAHRGDLVAALGLAGFESVPNDAYREHFEIARREGLHRVAHAGETAGPESIRSVLDDCGVERVGHGVAAIGDPELIDRLAHNGVPLEVCPSSNVRLGVVPDLASHPFERLRRAGLEVTLNSDDPPFFNSTLTQEYERVAATFGYGVDDLVAIGRAGLRHAFLSDEERPVWEERFERQLAALT